MTVTEWQAGDAPRAPIRPSRGWYWVAGGLLAGMAICIALAVAGFFSLNRQIQDFQRVRVPGHGEVTFAQPGGYVLYIERPGQCCSVSFGTGRSTPFGGWSMRVGLAPVAGGPFVPLRYFGTSTESYAVTGHQGQAVLAVTITRPGAYVLGAANVSPRSITDLAVGRGIGHAVLLPFLLIAVAVFVFLPSGLLVGGVTAYRRRRAHRMPPPFVQPAAEPWPGMGPSGPAAAYPGQPGPYPPGGYGATASAYLQGGPVGFGEAIKQAFANGFDYRGRASRSAYWWFALFELMAGVVLDLLIIIVLGVNRGGSLPLLVIGGIVAIVSIVAAIGLTLIGLSLLVRRLHDVDKSGWWVLLGLVPFVGAIVLLVFTLLEGTPGPNRYQP